MILHEGLKLKPYRCTAGKLTIGVGRNLEDVGITKKEAIEMLANDIARIELDLQTLPFYNELDDVRKKVIIDMVFNLGVGGFLKFKKTIAYIEDKYYHSASKEMLDSRWAKQVGQRAIRLSEMMRTGKDY